jgi:hypothetical protein
VLIAIHAFESSKTGARLPDTPLADARGTVEATCRRLFAGDGRTGRWERDDLQRFAAFLARLGGQG